MLGARARQTGKRLGRGCLTEYEARIAALERLVGKLALENEFLKGASGRAGLPRSASTCVVAGPTASPSPKDAD